MNADCLIDPLIEQSGFCDISETIVRKYSRVIFCLLFVLSLTFTLVNNDRKLVSPKVGLPIAIGSVLFFCAALLCPDPPFVKKIQKRFGFPDNEKP